MSPRISSGWRESAVDPSRAALQRVAEELLSRTAGVPRVEGNAVELLIDARGNFDAWLEAIASARTSVLLGNYMFGEDVVGYAIRDALIERAKAGVHVAVIRDWFGCLGESRDRFWGPLRAAGGEVRTYNPFRFTRPLGCLSRDHRKILVVDSTAAFVSGLCASAKWLGDRARGIAPWRDTGIVLRGPALQDVALSFSESWAELGDPLPATLPILAEAPPVGGAVAVRVVTTRPNTAGLYRLDQLVTAMARETLWLSDAYFVATGGYIQGMTAAARAGVDVRLLLPGRSDVPIIGPISRGQYRVLLEAGVRIYEWNGSMLHAKTAVIDGRVARVGSTNLNIASWLGNLELDVTIPDETFARRMEAQYREDLRGATEIVLNEGLARPRERTPAQPTAGKRSRAAAGALRVAHSVGAAVADRRALAPAEGGSLALGALALTTLSAIGFAKPRALAWPVAAVAAWGAIALAARFVGIRSASSRSPTNARNVRPLGMPRGRSRRAPTGITTG